MAQAIQALSCAVMVQALPLVEVIPTAHATLAFKLSPMPVIIGHETKGNNIMNHLDTLVKAPINSFMLQSIAGLFLRATKGTNLQGQEVPDVDPSDLEYLQECADSVAMQVLFQSKQQDAPIETADAEEDGIVMEFECPVFLIQMICTVLRAAADVLNGGNLKDIRTMAKAWVPMASAALRATLDTDGEREAFNRSWEASE